MDGVYPVAEAHEESELISSRTEVAGRAGRTRSRSGFHRFAKFSAVGAGGVIVQTVALTILLRVLGMHYLVATALAVEASVLNNFVWHRRWTWADRARSRAAPALLRFNATNGAMSLIGNLVLMFILVSVFKVNPHASNLITIGICSLVNFALADRFVFT